MMKPGKDSLNVGVLISDIQASLRFYQDLLGLEFIEKFSMAFGTLYRLRFGASDFKLIDPPTKPPKGAMGVGGNLGFRYITFIVRNLSELCEKLDKEGVEFTIRERETRPGVRIAMVKDPDGNIVEFVERKGTITQ